MNAVCALRRRSPPDARDLAGWQLRKILSCHPIAVDSDWWRDRLRPYRFQRGPVQASQEHQAGDGTAVHQNKIWRVFDFNGPKVPRCTIRIPGWPWNGRSTPKAIFEAMLGSMSTAPAPLGSHFFVGATRTIGATWRQSGFPRSSGFLWCVIHRLVSLNARAMLPF